MPRNRTLVCVVAHPDDDAYGLAGSVALHAAEPDFRFVLVHATDGPRTPGAPGRAENEAAWRAVGRPPDRHEWLGFPADGLTEVPLDELMAPIAAILDEEQPAVVTTFGPDGYVGHPDHVAVGLATDAAFAWLAGDSSEFLRLTHTAVPESVAAPPVVHPVPDEDIGVSVDCAAVADRVAAGRAVLDGPATDEAHEWHVLVHPPPIPGARVLADLFEGLD